MAIRSHPWRSVKSSVAKRKALAFSMLSGTMLAATGLAVLADNGVFGSRAEAASTAAYVPDVDSILDSRSPGQRRYGWLLNNKPERLAFSAENPPTERVLSSTRRRPASGSGVPNPEVPLTTLGIVPDTTVPPSDFGESGSFGGIGGPGGTPIVGGIPGPGPGPGGGGGGGGDDTPGNPVTPTPETPVAAVPEPSSWAMLVMGFAALGAFMRRRRSVPIAFTPQ